MKWQYLTAAVMGLGLAHSAFAYQAGKTYRFTVVHTNDTHGRFWENGHGEYGFAAEKAVIDAIKKDVAAKNGSVILLHAGDFNTGVPESDVQQAKPDIEGMNRIGFEATVLGNHEFDNPQSVLKQQERWANFPFLSANVLYKNTGKHFVKPYTILKKNGLKVAVVGLTTEDSEKMSSAKNVAGLSFADPTHAANKTLNEINRKEKPDVRIALTHMGYYNNANHGDNAPGDVTLARNLPKGAFDLIVGGHSHTRVCLNEDGSLNEKYEPTQACRPDFQNGTWIVQAGEWGKYVGRADFEFKDGKTRLVSYQLVPINLKKKVKGADGQSTYVPYTSFVPDSKLYNYLKTYQDKGGQLLNVKVGQTTGVFEGQREVVRYRPSNLGHLITQAMMERAQADIGIFNGGGIRDSLPAGELTYKDVLKVHPFGNILSHVTLTGAELQDYLSKVALISTGNGGYPHFTNNLKMTVNRTAGTVSDVTLNGKPLDMNKKYRIAFTNFNAEGGDGYPKLNKHPSYVETGYIDAEIMKDYLTKNSPVDAARFEPKNEIVFK